MKISTLSIFSFRGPVAKWWAFKQMPLSKRRLSALPGQAFMKMLGSGAGEGFSVKPDFSTYVLLQSWEHEEAASEFFNHHNYYSQLSFRCSGKSTVWLRAFKSKGSWNGEEPFAGQEGNTTPKLLAVLTRASIKPRLLYRFWQQVPRVSRSVYKQPGRLYSKGVGEWPLIEQATFSVWDGPQVMENFAYRQKEHKAVVQKTRALNWYSEELFARFEVLRITGDKLFDRTMENS